MEYETHYNALRKEKEEAQAIQREREAGYYTR
jgi:hypothetical protein